MLNRNVLANCVLVKGETLTANIEKNERDLGEFASMGKRLLVSSCLSVFSALYNSAPTEWTFMKFEIRRFFENL